MNNSAWLGYNRAEWRTIFGCLGAWVVGYIIYATTPILLEGFVGELQFSMSSAGSLISTEFAGIGIISIFLGTVIHRISKRALALCGCLLALSANVLCVISITHDYLFLVRLLAGVGTGMAIVGGAAAISKYNDPERKFGTVNFLVALVMSTALVAAGYSFKNFGSAGIFGLMALFNLVMLPLLFLLPVDIHRASENRSKDALPFLGLGALFILGFVTALTFKNAGWIFGATIGTASGLTIEQVGSVIGVSTLLGISGALLSTWVGTRFGRVLPIILGLSAMGGSWLIMCLFQTPAVFIGGMIVNGISFLFNVSFLVGMSATLDKWGRWASIAAGFQLLGSILGPVIGGWLVDTGGIALLGWVSFLGTVAALIPLLIVAQRLGTNNLKPAVAPAA